MFSSSPAASYPRARLTAGAYQQVGVQTMVNAATPHGLVSMLFDGFIAAANRAKGAMRAGDIAAKGQAISHAMRIIDEGLKAALDLKTGGQLAADLSSLYAYVCVRLMHANLHGDSAAVDECITLVMPLREAWTSIGAAQPAAVAASN